MRLTSFTDFGLRVLMRLAGQPDAVLSTEQVAREFAISRHHLQKVVQDLAAAGFVRTAARRRRRADAWPARRTRYGWARWYGRWNATRRWWNAFAPTAAPAA